MTCIVEKFAAAYREVAMMDRDRMTMAEQAYYFGRVSLPERSEPAGGTSAPDTTTPHTMHKARGMRAHRRRLSRG